MVGGIVATASLRGPSDDPGYSAVAIVPAKLSILLSTPAAVGATSLGPAPAGVPSSKLRGSSLGLPWGPLLPGTTSAPKGGTSSNNPGTRTRVPFLGVAFARDRRRPVGIGWDRLGQPWDRVVQVGTG